MFEHLHKFIDNINELVGGFMVKVSPLTAPIPSAFTVFSNINAQGVHMAVALALAFAIESIGFAVAHISIKEWTNGGWSNTMFRVCSALCAIYLVAVGGLIAGYEAIPAVVKWWAGQIESWQMVIHVTPLVFPLLNVVGATIYAVSSQHRTMETKVQKVDKRKDEREQAEFELDLEMKRARELAKIERQNAKAGVPSGVPQNVPSTTSSSVPTSGIDTVPNTTPEHFDEQFLNIISEHGWSPKTLKDQLGIGRTTVYTHRDRLIKEGKLYQNGTVKITDSVL